MELSVPPEAINDFTTIIKYQNTKLIHAICQKYKWEPSALMDLIFK